MRIGIIGDAEDAQCQAVAREAEALGAEALVIDFAAFERGTPFTFDGPRTLYARQPVDDIRGFYLRFIPAPFAPALERDGTLVLHEDWHTEFMRTRERAGFFLSWLMRRVDAGVAVINPPAAASVLQDKPLQLQVLERLGARVPRTLVTNDALAVRAFQAQVGDVIYKPLLGGAYARRLDAEALGRLELLSQAPVIFQEYVRGEDWRVTVVGDKVVSCAAVVTDGRHVDFREDAGYRAGAPVYREERLPEDVEALCVRVARGCGLPFTGMDLKRGADGFTFLELNSSPVYLGVERRLGHPISRELARLVVERARASAECR